MCSISLNAHLSSYKAIKMDIRVFKDIYRAEDTLCHVLKFNF